MKNVKKYLSNQRGVTLIEILAVIVIIGILAAIAVPAVLGQINKAEEKSAAATVQIIQDAADRYFILEENPGEEVTLGVLKTKKYLKDIPKDYVEADKVKKDGTIVEDDTEI